MQQTQKEILDTNQVMSLELTFKFRRKKTSKWSIEGRSCMWNVFIFSFCKNDWVFLHSKRQNENPFSLLLDSVKCSLMQDQHNCIKTLVVNPYYCSKCMIYFILRCILLIYLFVNITGEFFGSEVNAWALSVSLYVKHNLWLSSLTKIWISVVFYDLHSWIKFSSNKYLKWASFILITVNVFNIWQKFIFQQVSVDLNWVNYICAYSYTCKGEFFTKNAKRILGQL